MDSKTEIQAPRSRSRIPATGAVRLAGAAAIAATTLLGTREGVPPVYGAGETPTPVPPAAASLRATETAKAQATQIMAQAEARMTAAAVTSTARPQLQATSTKQAAETATAVASLPTATPARDVLRSKNNYSWYTFGGLVNWGDLLKVASIITATVVSVLGLRKVIKEGHKGYVNQASSERASQRARGVGEDRGQWGIAEEFEQPQLPQAPQVAQTPELPQAAVAPAPPAQQPDEFVDLAQLLRGDGGNPDVGGDGGPSAT